VAVIDIGGYSLKVLSKAKAREFVLAPNTAGGTFTLPILDSEKMMPLLSRVRKETGVSRCSLVLPDQWARQLFVSFENDETHADISREYVIWRAKGQIRDEVHSGSKIDAHVIEVSETPDKKQHISAYLCLIKYEILNKITDAFNQSGIEIKNIDLSCHAIYNYLSAAGNLASDFCLINVGYEVCTLYFFVNYQPAYVRIIETAGKHFESEMAADKTSSSQDGIDSQIAEKQRKTAELCSKKIFPEKFDPILFENFENSKKNMVEKFLKEIYLTFEFFSSKYPQIKLSRVLLAGGMCKFGGLDFFLSNFLELKVELASTLDLIHYLPLYGMKE